MVSISTELGVRAGKAVGRKVVEWAEERGGFGIKSAWRKWKFGTADKPEMNNDGIGMQDGLGGVGQAAPLAMEEMGSNRGAEPFLIQSTIGRTQFTFTRAANASVAQQQVNFQASGGGGFNGAFLTAYANALDVYNYYELLTVEFWVFSQAGFINQNTSNGLFTLGFIPWTAQYNIGNVTPSTDLSLLRGYEVFPLVVRNSSQTQVEPVTSWPIQIIHFCI